MRNAFINKLFELAKINTNINIITGDLGFGVMNPFMESLPQQFFNAGICEQNMTSVASGMALEGKTVFTYSIANFTTMRCLEQLRNDVAYHELPVKAIAVGGGFAYGYLGMSHHATEDISITRAIPNIEIFCPADPAEAVAVADYSATSQKPAYIRLGRGGEKNINNDKIKDIFKARKLKEGYDTVILCTGSIANDAIAAAEILDKENISTAVYSFTSIKPIDENFIIELSGKYSNIFTLEEHNIVGGFGGAVAEVVSGIKTNTILFRFGLKDEFTSVVGSQEYLKKHYKLDAKSVSRKIKEKI